MPISEERLVELEALCQAAEKEPWHMDSSPYNETAPFIVRTDNGWVVAAGITHVSDAKFIADVRTVIPELIAEVQRLRECFATLIDTPELTSDRAIAIAKAALEEGE